jgi:membrane-bound lytic murein transglycosylase B
VSGSASSIVSIMLLVASLVAGGRQGSQAHRRPEAVRSVATPSSSALLPTSLPSAGARLGSYLNQAQAIIDDPSSSSLQLVSAARFEQLATAQLAGQPPRIQRGALASLDRRTAATMRTNLDAAAALARLAPPRRSLPRWRIIQPPRPQTLLSYFSAAQTRLGVRWEYLAAIEFIESRFGRVDGLSAVGAEGPMQFMPGTWAAYGRGDVHNPRDAIFGAARYLVASGAPADMAGALYHYNPSRYYVRAVVDYAGRLRSDPRAFYGYYYWQVLYQFSGHRVVLPTGYPKVHPLPFRP